MEHKKLNRLIASAVFLSSLLVYIKTLSPTVVFWDVGEFCAAAFSMQVPHPPGAPLFLLLARLSSMIPFVQDIAVRMHVLSAIGSAITCGLLYLIIVDFMVMWKGIPNTYFEKVILYGSAFIGALSLAFTSTFWFNALEAEVYGLSMTFVGLIILLGLRWYERSDEDSGDRYILLIAYILGLSVGVHLLAILALFPVMFFWYFRNYRTFQWISFLKFGAAALFIFFVIYPGIVKFLPSLLDGEIGGTKNEFITFIPIAIILAALYGIYYSVQKKKQVLNIALLSFLLIILGYSTYTMVYIRANAHTPMNENDPSTMGRLVSYLNREQYGDAPILNRRWDPDPDKKRYHQNYSSDLDYMWRYQIEHMYLRYLGWNYIGSEGDFRGAGVDWRKFYLIPFILGLIGAYYQWRKQPYIGFSMIVTFIIMGVILALYQNQQEPQPRERDYFYVGSFFIFSLWIAYGVIAFIDLVRERIKAPQMAQTATYCILILAFIFVPVKMLKTNYHQANRTGNYIAWDYSYNMLQSCEKDAILITNGDNDTFPLWYLQDVEGIRRDIRIVNLSLANTPWYIKQLKHETPYGAKQVPISIADVDIENIRPIPFNPSWIELPVSPDMVNQYRAEGDKTISRLDTSVINSGVIRFLMPNTIQFGNIKGIRVQDIIVYSIISTSNWQRPIYFALTMPDNGKIGLQDYMQLTGLAFKLVPWRTNDYWSNLNEPIVRQNLFTNIKQTSKELQYGFQWRGLRDSTTYFDEDTRNLITANYRNTFISYALYSANIKKQPQQVSFILDRMEEIIPRRSIAMDYRIKYDIASVYAAAGNEDRYKEFANEVIVESKKVIDKPVTDPISRYNPFIILYYCYEGLGMYKEAEELFPQIKSAYSNQQGIDQFIAQMADRLRAKREAAHAERQTKTPGAINHR